MTNIHKYVWVGLHAVYAFGLLLIFVFSGSKYDWMADSDPLISLGANEDASGNRAVFLTLVLVTIVVAQSIAAFNACKPRERLISMLLMVVAAFAFLA